MTAILPIRIMMVCFLIAVLLPVADLPAQPVFSGTRDTVTTIVDEDDGTMLGTVGTGTSLREAVLYSDTGDVIIFDASLSGTILLTLGEISMDHDLIIAGPGNSVIDVSGLCDSRIFNVGTGVALELSGLTLSNGRGLDGGALLSDGWLRVEDCLLRTSTAVQHGGAIYHTGDTLRLDGSTFEACTAYLDGGAVFSGGWLGIEDCVLRTSTAMRHGGAVYHAGTWLILTRCTVELCTAFQDGGGVLSNGSNLSMGDSECDYNRANDEGGSLYVASGVAAIVSRSTFAENEAHAGAGIANYGSLSFHLSTVSGNQATGKGGGIYNASTFISDFCTIAQNSAGIGGGVNNGGSFTTSRCLIAENSAGTDPDASGSFLSQGYNLIGKQGSSSGWIGSDIAGTMSVPANAALDGLYMNGGLTRTHALLICSEAIDAADSTGATLLTDQRGYARCFNGDSDPSVVPDIGAFEVQSVLDMTAPFVMVNQGFVVFLDSIDGKAILDSGQLIIFATDECKIISKSISRDTLTCNDLDSVSISMHVEDQSHNSWDSTMTIGVQDITAPKFDSLPPPATVYAPPNACSVDLTETLIGSATAIDNCTVQSVDFTPKTGIPVGVTSVQWTAEDSRGNITSRSQTVTVVDTTDPLAVAPPDINVNTTATRCGVSQSDLDLGLPAVTEACSYTCINDAPSTFPLGTTTVVWTITDASGNFTTVTQDVTVEDHIPPTIIPPPDLILSTDANSCSRLVSNVNLGTPNVTDNCTVASYSPAQPATEYPIGSTDVIWSVYDGSGNGASATQKVTIIDASAPVIVAPPDITVAADPGECYWTVIQTVLGVPTNLSDNCGVPTATNNAGATLPVGLHRIVWIAVDANGNSTEDVQLVTVTGQPPTISCPSNIAVYTDAGEPGAVVSYTVPVGSSTCPGVETIRTLGLGSGAFFPVGTTTEEYTVIDASNQSVSCSFTVTVTDNEKPGISVELAPRYLWPATNKLVTVYATVEATDNCEGVGVVLKSITSNQPPDAPDIVGASTGVFDDLFQLRAKKDKNKNRIFTVTYEAEDAYGNKQEGSATVEVPAHKPKDYEEIVLPVPDDILLAQNFPNPFNPNTTITFGIPDARHVSVFIYNAMGRKVRTLIDLDLDAGVYNMEWDSRNDAGVRLPSGLYICRMTAGKQNLERKMLLAR